MRPAYSKSNRNKPEGTKENQKRIQNMIEVEVNNDERQVSLYKPRQVILSPTLAKEIGGSSVLY